MLKVITSEKFQHFVHTLPLFVLLIWLYRDVVIGVEGHIQVVVVLLHVVTIVRNGAQTERKLATCVWWKTSYVLIRGLFVRLLVDQSTNWSTNCSFSALILVDQMSILVDELIDQQTNK